MGPELRHGRPDQALPLVADQSRGPRLQRPEARLRSQPAVRSDMPVVPHPGR
jgi:hypothetical protein